MKVSFITTNKALDIHNWSGTIYHLARSMEAQGAEVNYIGELNFRKELLFKAKQLLYKGLGKTYIRNRERFVAEDFARQVSEYLPDNTDIVFSPESISIAYLKTSKPKVLFADATFASMVNYYDNYSNLCEETLRKGNLIEQQAFDSCALAIFSSKWAAESAANDYGLSPKKIRIVPLGANIKCDRNVEDIKDLISNKERNKCKLLFLGVDWDRKGGDLAVAVTKLLNEKGLPTELSVVGINKVPESVSQLNYVKSFGFISKSTEEGRNRIDEFMKESHFLIVPSKAEAYGVVYCEASSFGVPSLATKTGGITTVIQDNVNGCTFDLNSSAGQYAEYILSKFQDYSAYQNLAMSSFNDYETRLNWEVAGKSVVDCLRELV